MSTSKYVVVGAGLAGAATALSLARNGHEVTVLERTRPAAHDGSSHGSARIFRYAYPEPFYARLVAQSRPLWDELEQLAGQPLITLTGSLDFGSARNPGRLAEVLTEVGVEHELLSQDAARGRWPGIAFDTDVLWHPAAGVLDAERAVLAMLEQAQNHGARVLTGWPVASVQQVGPGHRLTSTAGDRMDAENVVVCAGGWLPELLADLPLPQGLLEQMPAITVSQEYAYHFPYRRDAGLAVTTDFWPTFIHKTDRVRTYSLPGGRDADFRGQKLAEYNGGRPLWSASEQDGVIDPGNRQRVIDYVRHQLPGLVPEPYAETTCLFTSTPTEDFVIDGACGLTIVSPCSGHGAKFAPLIGQIAADVATGRAAAPRPFRIGGSSADADPRVTTHV